MEVKATIIFLKKLDVLVKKEIISYAQYRHLRCIYKKEPLNHKIRPHKIQCNKNDNIISLSIPNTQIRLLVLILCKPKKAIFVWIGKHREYETIIKDSRNCKKITFNCDKSEANNITSA